MPEYAMLCLFLDVCNYDILVSSQHWRAGGLLFWSALRLQGCGSFCQTLSRNASE